MEKRIVQINGTFLYGSVKGRCRGKKCVCGGCACVCVREKERERETETS
jgi:hypothetical protein